MSELLLDRPAKLAELDAIEAESIGWQPLGDGAYGDVLFFVCGAVSESVLVSFSVVRG
jgi:hypothetical protein